MVVLAQVGCVPPIPAARAPGPARYTKLNEAPRPMQARSPWSVTIYQVRTLGALHRGRPAGRPRPGRERRAGGSRATSSVHDEGAAYNRARMHGFVAVTDPGWYERLARTPGPKDANFWRPSARAFRLDVGTPFLFKLKAPYNAIAGFGYFAGFSILPDWLPWDTFGEANGVDSLAALRARLTSIPAGARIRPNPEAHGCLLIAEPASSAGTWGYPPQLAPRTQTGARYKLPQARPTGWNEAPREPPPSNDGVSPAPPSKIGRKFHFQVRPGFFA